MPTDSDAIFGVTRYNPSSNPSNDILDAKRCDPRNLRPELQRWGRIENQDFEIDIFFGSEVAVDEPNAIDVEIGPVLEEMSLKLKGSPGKI